MANLKALLLVALVLYSAMLAAVSQEKARSRERGEEEEEEIEPWKTGKEAEEGGRWEKKEQEEQEMRFLLKDAKRVVSTEAGEMRVVRGYAGIAITEKPLHIGFITMEPRSLFIPQYLDSSLIIFLCRGEAKIGLIFKDELVERQLRAGDVYRLPAGSAFYIVNTGEGQRLHIICSIDLSEGLGFNTFQSFFIAGGANPTSVLAGFDPQTLSTAFNVSIDKLGEIMIGQQAGPIVYIDAHGPSIWSNFLELKQQEKLQHLKRMVPVEDDNEEKQDQPKWSVSKLFNSLLLGEENKKGRDQKGERKAGPDPYNLYERSPDFINKYGWSLAVDHHDYSPLKKSDIGIYLVNLTAGSMMAPHVNPRASEYGIVLKGTGTIHIVYPNGTSALKAKLKEGSVFWVPRYFPFCQIAARSGPFEFFGFTTSSHRNRPQFLVGASSILKTMRGPELAVAFGVTEERLREIIDAQREAIILPSPAAAPPDERREVL